MEEKEKYIGVNVPASIADALYKKKQRTGVSITRQIIDSLKKTFKMKEAK